MCDDHHSCPHSLGTLFATHTTHTFRQCKKYSSLSQSLRHKWHVILWFEQQGTRLYVKLPTE
ncbi:unnamed protein product [Acanthoscelides obtectus]|uniref:Uncharacterized protein n=1 Tax=Acanthoscelides obtectus TaxID=200917 RepID=A0A9P0VSQ7_ACAOB|nr:unnamed protein product [Acanthoscelides obtectus]CAK1682731.1 hypothetical protein AOBTE_LOCUS33835 [Acanthoscelides obtectus]